LIYHNSAPPSLPFGAEKGGVAAKAGAPSFRLRFWIDYWLQCRGVWLDRGELDKIIERSAAPAPAIAQAPAQPAPQPQAPNPAQLYAQQPHYDQKYHYKRKKSWLEDIFDKNIVHKSASSLLGA
jgi:uncharacterized protein